MQIMHLILKVFDSIINQLQIYGNEGGNRAVLGVLMTHPDVVWLSKKMTGRSIALGRYTLTIGCAQSAPVVLVETSMGAMRVQDSTLCLTPTQLNSALPVIG